MGQAAKKRPRKKFVPHLKGTTIFFAEKIRDGFLALFSLVVTSTTFWNRAQSAFEYQIRIAYIAAHGVGVIYASKWQTLTLAKSSNVTGKGFSLGCGQHRSIAHCS